MPTEKRPIMLPNGKWVEHATFKYGTCVYVLYTAEKKDAALFDARERVLILTHCATAEGGAR